MGQKTTRNTDKLTDTQKRKARRKGRQLQVLHRKVMGQTVKEIAEQTGFSESTLWKDIKELRNQGIDKDLIERERNIHIKALPIATAVLFAHLMLGDKEVAMGMSKGLKVWTDKLDIVAKVAPDEQQKKMMENMETLLKLSKDKVKRALPEKTTAMEKTKEEGELAVVEGSKFVGYVDKVEQTKKAETQSQLGAEKTVEHHFTGEAIRFEKGCTCPNQEVTDKADYTIDPKCPVHGDKKQEHQIKDEDKDRGGGHPPPRGSEV